MSTHVLRGAMPPRAFSLCALAALSCLGSLAAPARSEWPTSAAAPFFLGLQLGEEIEPLTARTPNGGAYFGWFVATAPEGELELRLQRLDAAGNELWPHGGILI